MKYLKTVFVVAASGLRAACWATRPTRIQQRGARGDNNIMVPHMEMLVPQDGFKTSFSSHVSNYFPEYRQGFYPPAVNHLPSSDFSTDNLRRDPTTDFQGANDGLGNGDGSDFTALDLARSSLLSSNVGSESQRMMDTYLHDDREFGWSSEISPGTGRQSRPGTAFSSTDFPQYNINSNEYGVEFTTWNRNWPTASLPDYVIPSRTREFGSDHNKMQGWPSNQPQHDAGAQPGQRQYKVIPKEAANVINALKPQWYDTDTSDKHMAATPGEDRELSSDRALNELVLPLMKALAESLSQPQSETNAPSNSPESNTQVSSNGSQGTVRSYKKRLPYGGEGRISAQHKLNAYQRKKRSSPSEPIADDSASIDVMMHNFGKRLEELLSAGDSKAKTQPTITELGTARAKGGHFKPREESGNTYQVWGPASEKLPAQAYEIGGFTGPDWPLGPNASRKRKSRNVPGLSSFRVERPVTKALEDELPFFSYPEDVSTSMHHAKRRKIEHRDHMQV